MRSVIVLGVGLLFALILAGQAVAGVISITGDRQLEINVRDADRVEALIALFRTAGGKRVLQLSDGVTGRIDRLQLSEVPFEAALQAMLGDEYRFETGSNGSAAVLYRIINPKVPAPVVAPPPEPEPAALPVVILDDPRFSTVLYIDSIGTGSGTSRASTSNRTRVQPMGVDRRSRGLRYTESVPYIMTNEYFDPFGRIIRQPNIYYDTHGIELDLDNGLTMYPDWSGVPYLDPPLDLDDFELDEDDVADE
ncbi:MAG: hypothetical protein ACYC6A_14540 [Armatimonadota bacterium]